jgi:hypothetical protein
LYVPSELSENEKRVGEERKTGPALRVPCGTPLSARKLNSYIRDRTSSGIKRVF